MRSLRDIYEEINKNNEWSYYQNPNIELLDRLFSDLSGKRSIDFIQKYFNIAGKSTMFEDKQIITHREIIERRANHIISTFLVGIVARDRMKDVILKKYSIPLLRLSTVGSNEKQKIVSCLESIENMPIKI